MRRSIKKNIGDIVYGIKLFAYAAGLTIGLVILPIVVITWVSSDIISLALSIVCPELYQVEVEMFNGVRILSFLSGVIVGMVADYVIVLFACNYFNCYKRRNGKN